MSNNEDDFVNAEEATGASLGEQMVEIAKSLDNAKKNRVKAGSSGQSDTRDPRATREMETREADMTPLTWRPASVLPDPPQRPGWKHRWVRASSRGSIDKVNMARAMQEEWRPCAASDYPEIVDLIEGEDRGSNLIEYGGLVLCRMPEALAKARDEYFNQKARRQINAVNERLANEQRAEGRVAYINESVSSRK